MEEKMCILEDDKRCDDCCECNICDLDSAKVCDNCAKCLDVDEEYVSYTIKDLVKVEESHKKAHLQRAKIMLKLRGKLNIGRRQSAMK